MEKKEIKIRASQKITANRIGMTRAIFVVGDKLFTGYLWEKENNTYLRISCLDKNNLSVIWEKDILGLYYYCHPLSDNKMICVGYHNNVICLDNDNGETIWKYESDLKNEYGIHFGVSSNIENNRFVVIGSRKETSESKSTYDLYCISSINGSLCWHVTIDAHSQFTQIEDGKVYIGTLKSLYCFDVQNGNKIWDIKCKKSGPLILGDFIIRAESSTINFYSKENGFCLKSFIVTPELQGTAHIESESGYTEFSNSMFSSIEKLNAYDNNVYACTESGTVYALDVKKKKNLFGKLNLNIETLWTFDAEHLNHLDDARVPECPISICAQFNEEFIIVGEDTFKVSLLDPKTGNVISCIKPKLKNLLKEVFVDENSIYLMCDKGWIYKGEINMINKN